MAFEVITKYNSPNYTPESQVPSLYGKKRTIEAVVYHWWGDPKAGATFQGIINYLCRANGNTSAHVVGEAGRVAWIVEARHSSWHSGNSWGNSSTIGYECNPRLSDGDYQTMGEFHADLEKTYGKTLGIYVHKDLNKSTACSPIDKARIRRIADQVKKGNTTTPAPAKPAISKWNTKKEFTTLNAKLVDITSGKTVKTFNNGDKLQLAGEVVYNGVKYYMTEYSISKNVLNGIDSRNLNEIKKEAPKPEWIANTNVTTYPETIVVAKNGAVVTNLENGSKVGNVIPYGTVIDVKAETTVGGKKYFISKYSYEKGLPQGIEASMLGEKPKEVSSKPQWILNNVTEGTFWIRSKVDGISIKDGKTVKTYKKNDKVVITHKAEYAENTYYITKDNIAIPQLYLSDKEVPANEGIEKVEVEQVSNGQMSRQLYEDLKELFERNQLKHEEMMKRQQSTLDKILEIVKSLLEKVMGVFK